MTRALEVAIAGIGAIGPGLPDWDAGSALLADPAQWIAASTAIPSPSRMPATERRRAGSVVKLSIAVADQALAMAGRAAPIDAGTMPTVFSSSTGDPLNCHLLCEALATPERALSPTRFTNSVHNTPAGYWHIATASMAPSTSIAAFDAGFGAGLLEAAAQCRRHRGPVLLVAADVPYPEPLHGVRPLADSFGVALVLAPARQASGPLAIIEVADTDAGPTRCDHDGLEQVRRTIPAARALPLLQALARRQDASIVIDAADGLQLRLRLAHPA